ncbi:hypothetical protein PanWU01x14_308070 [Parasponia andersonii]|uniref:Uncharacterized protein n=1 Tax=Parasponia andersonii TaxID=3476 RepID=A0A2P5AR91_PARAD|nr:hypothetical protein PanWU01x14_308070 [Parasponia andersonii]
MWRVIDVANDLSYPIGSYRVNLICRCMMLSSQVPTARVMRGC